ncbi:hypothetical protein ACOTFF_21740 [Achromobacter xylosoxidans]
MSRTDKQTLILAFIKTRNAARSATARLNRLMLDQRVSRRQLKRAEMLVDLHAIPPNVVPEIRAHIEATESLIAETRTSRVEIGELLNRILPCLDAELSLNERYDLLNVNPVHRQWTGTDAPSSLEMIMAHGLEDSAARHDRAWLDGPLFECLHAKMWHFFRTDPKGRATLDFMTAEVFGPGGLFEHATLQRMHDDGTIEEIPPSERAKAPAGVTLH